MQKQTQTNKTSKGQKPLPTPTTPDMLPHESYYTDEWLEWTQAIRSLNDAFRLTFTSTELYCSPDVLKLSQEDQESILERVRHYRIFNEINDPLMLHNQGIFLHKKTPIVWVIYYHEEEYKPLHQVNPVDIDLTNRHMMIMTASEWWKKLPENIF